MKQNIYLYAFKISIKLIIIFNDELCILISYKKVKCFCYKVRTLNYYYY